MLEQTEWGEFRLWELFDINPTKYYRLSNEEIISEGWKTPLISNWSINNGVMGFSNLEPNNRWNSITCSDTTIWCDTMFYQEKDFIWYSHIQHLVPKITPFNKALALIIISACRTATSNKQYDYWNKFNRETMNNTIIKLPIKNWHIDFEFINRFIAELEATHQAELEAYLRMTWLKNYELTSSELELLKVFKEWKIEWWKFQIWWEDWLFNINSSKKKFDANKVNIWENWHNYIVRTSLNNWIRGFINENTDFLNNWNTISFWQDTATMFYQEESYFTWDKIKILSSKNNRFNKFNALFLITTMTKIFSSFSWWNSSFNTKIIESQNISIPIKNWKPDYELMEKFIWAIQKLVIKDVAIYNEIKLKTNKEIINKEIINR